MLLNCKVSTTETLKFDKSLDYKTKELNLFQTLKKGNNEFVDEVQLERIASRMSKTHLKNSLSKFKYYWKEFPIKEVEDIFSKFLISIYKLIFHHRQVRIHAHCKGR